MKEFLGLKELILEKFGININDDKLNTILTYFKKTYDLDAPSLLKILGNNDVMLSELIDKLTVPETYFFRNEEHALIFKDIIEKNFFSRNRLMILSAGCSTGEEPYTHSIMLKEYFPRLFENSIIYAIDLNKMSIEKAKNGIFGNSSFRNNCLGLKDKYFNQVEKDRYKIHEDLKGIVKFIQGNIMDHDYEILSKKFDIILCRNVFIYFEKDKILKVLNRFFDLMHEDSYLFVGYSEMINQITKKFQSIIMRNSFVFQKAVEDIKDEKKESYDIPVLKYEASDKIMIDRKKHSKDDDLKGIRFLISLENYDKAKRDMEKYLDKDPENISALLLNALIFSFYQKYGDGLNILKDIEMKGYRSYDLYLIKGLLYSEMSDFIEAIKNFKLALSFNPICLISHFFLAFLYEEKRFYTLSERYYQIIHSNNDLVIDTKIKEILPHLSGEQLRTLAKDKVAYMKKNGG